MHLIDPLPLLSPQAARPPRPILQLSPVPGCTGNIDDYELTTQVPSSRRLPTCTMSAMANKSRPIPRPSTPRPSTPRQKNRVSKPAAVQKSLPTPRPSQSPSPHVSRPSTPLNTVVQSRRRTAPKNVTYTTTCAANGSQQQQQQQQQSTVNWECISYVVSEQKIHSAYEKPAVEPGTNAVTSYGRIVTTTTTTTVTTTIATTEILHPGEPGYEESLARQQALALAAPEERQMLENRFQESRSWSAGTNKADHEMLHQDHHRSAEPTKAIYDSANA